MSSSSRQSNRSIQKRLGAACLLEALEPRKLLSAVPAPLTSVDVGTPTGGSASFNGTNQTFTVVGAGDDIYGAADAFHYVYEPLTGNGTVTVKITGDNADSDESLAGLDIRDSLSTTAANLWVAARDDGSVFVNSRASDAGVGGNDVQSEPGIFPEYLQITRTGDTVVAGYSTNGGLTYQTTTQTINFSGNTVLVGLAVSSQAAPTTLTTATFSNFSVSAAGATSALSTPAVSAGASTPYEFTVHYNSANQVNASTIGNNNYVVELPDGTTEGATLVSTGLADGTTVAATYEVPAPTTTGTYTVIPGTIPAEDLLGNDIEPIGTIGTFVVSSPTPPTSSDTITGLVRSPTLAPVAGATVTAGSATATTDASGAYTLTGLTDGSYTVAETAPSGQQVLPIASESVTVTGSETLSNIDFVNTAANTTSSTNNLTGAFASKFAGSIKAGSKVHANVKIIDSGTSTIGSTVDVTELLTTNGTASGAVAVLETVAVKLKLKPGKSQTAPLSFTYPSTTSTGSYKVVAVIDSGNALAESNKLDNVITGSAVNITGPSIVAALKSAPRVTKSSVKPYKFTVTYTAAVGKVSPSSIDSNNWIVELPSGSVEATLLASKPAAASKLVATYTVPAPTVNGTYTIESSSVLAADQFGDKVAAGTLGTFSVALPSA